MVKRKKPVRSKRRARGLSGSQEFHSQALESSRTGIKGHKRAFEQQLASFECTNAEESLLLDAVALGRFEESLNSISPGSYYKNAEAVAAFRDLKDMLKRFVRACPRR